MTRIRVGIGGWTYAPWRGAFYPKGLPAARELEYAASRLTSIEINGTFYRTQTPESFAKWRDATPDGFVFSVKAPRAATYTREPAKAEASVKRFLNSGLTELGGKLGPLLWQFPPTRKFDAEFPDFLALLPAAHDGAKLRHVVELRHASFDTPELIELLRRHHVARAIIESGKHTLFGDVTADFVYARLERNAAAEPEGYAAPALDAWHARAKAWAAGRGDVGLKLLAPAATHAKSRDCFLYFISGDKERAPDAAMAMLARL